MVTRFQNLIYRLYRKIHMRLFGLKPGCFIQNIYDVVIEDGVQLSHGVHIYTQNHNLVYLNHLDEPNEVRLMKDCWIGANSIILPGVVLGPHTVVAAGSVVTKSFIDGWCVIAGNPAQKIRDIEVN